MCKYCKTIGEWKLINGDNVSIVGEMHHSKECGHDSLCSINVIMSKEEIEVQWALHQHDINKDSFPSYVIRMLGRNPKGSRILLLNVSTWLEVGLRLGYTRACQAIEDRILIDSPSSIIVQCVVE